MSLNRNESLPLFSELDQGLVLGAVYTTASTVAMTAAVVKDSNPAARLEPCYPEGENVDTALSFKVFRQAV